MKFTTSVGTAVSGEPIYDRAEYSFRFDNMRLSDRTDGRLIAERTSLAVGTLQLAVGVQSGLALFVWGYMPWFGWAPGAANPLDLQPGTVTAHVDGGFTAGVAKRLAAVGEWSTVFDKKTGYVHISRDSSRVDDRIILIATSTSLGLVKDELHSIWVKPKFINDPA